METLTSNRVASPGLHQLVLSTYASCDPWGSDPGVDSFSALLDLIRPEEAIALPESVGRITPLLVQDVDRYRVILDAVVRMDLYEALEGLRPLLIESERGSILAAAALVGVRHDAGMIGDLVRVASVALTPAEQDLVACRLDPGYTPSTDVGRWEQRARWNFGSPLDAALPAAIVDRPSDRFTSFDHLRVVAHLASIGATILRRPHRDIPSLARYVPVIGPESTGDFQIQSPLSHSALRTLEVNIRNRYRRAAFLTPTSAPRTRGTVISHLHTVDDLREGALHPMEVAWLTGSTQRQLDRASGLPFLKPRTFKRRRYWRFDQVVGLRVASYLFALSGRREGLFTVASRIVEAVERHEMVPIGVTTSGRVVVSEGGQPVDLESRQAVLGDVLSVVDEVYEPFVLSKSAVPSLLQPTAHTTVHPAVARGAPCVAGTRIPISAIATAVTTLRLSRPDAEEVAAVQFALTTEQVVDAVSAMSDMRASAAR